MCDYAPELLMARVGEEKSKIRNHCIANGTGQAILTRFSFAVFCFDIQAIYLL